MAVQSYLGSPTYFHVFPSDWTVLKKTQTNACILYNLLNICIQKDGIKRVPSQKTEL
jgi:hypothetical protein